MAIEQSRRDVPVATTYADRPIPSISWGAVFAGAFVGVGVWILLHLLGMGAGLTAIRPEHTGSLRGIGIGTGIWTVIAPILALFVGGFVVGRLAGPLTGVTGAIHGAVMWSIATIAAAILAMAAVSAVVRTSVRVGGEAITSVVRAGPQTLETLGLEPNELIAPVNQRLAEQGKPAITADQITSAARDALSTSIRQGRLDREVLTTSIAEKTALSRADASDIANRIEQRFEDRTSEMREGALGAAEGTGKVMLALFGALSLGLLASITGASLGVRNERRRWTRGTGYRGDVAVVR